MNTNSSARLSGIKILVVDDEELICDTLKDLFEGDGASVETRTSAIDALVLMEVENFDAIVTDIRMPGMDGVQLLNKISDTLKHQPQCFVMTGYSQISLDNIKNSNLQAVFTKPFVPEKMIARISQAVRGRDKNVTDSKMENGFAWEEFSD